MEIFEKMTHKSQTIGSSDNNDDNFNEYDDENYKGDIPPY